MEEPKIFPCGACGHGSLDEEICTSCGKQIISVDLSGDRFVPRIGNNFILETECINCHKISPIGFQAKGRALIHACESADLSTILYELGHIARRYLDAKSAAIIENRARVENGLWSRKAEEKFTRYFKRYMRTGKAPTEHLKEAFAKIREWMREIYQTLKGSELVTLNREKVTSHQWQD